MKHSLHYVKKEVGNHSFDYIVLISLSILYLSSLFIFRDVKSYQLLSTVIFAVLYVFWGMIHHHYDKTIHHDNVLEYIFIAILAIIILQIALFK